MSSGFDFRCGKILSFEMIILSLLPATQKGRINTDLLHSPLSQNQKKSGKGYGRGVLFLPVLYVLEYQTPYNCKIEWKSMSI